MAMREKSLLWVATAWLATVLSVGTAMGQPPYEPNDSPLTAYGPLAANSTYTAALETDNDEDLFYFYVTTPSTAQVTFTLTNLGGGPQSEPALEGVVTNSHGSTISEIGSFIFPSDYATHAVSLTAGKYFVEIRGYGYGESYRLETSGTEGAFGDYATIAANCAAATVPVITYQAQLATAEAKLRKAAAQLRKLRYSRHRRARKKAQARSRHLKAVVVAEKASLKEAENSQKPWCFIPA
jgi:hypothetical protein